MPRELRQTARRLYPVGRLDRDSEGLLLLTNDGGWTERILHPRHGVEREYAVGLSAPLTPAQARWLRDGIELDEGVGRLFALREATGAEVRKLRDLVEADPTGLRWYRTVLRHGWRRYLRRMFAAVGAPVARLVRVRIATLWLEDLAPGQLRALTAKEAARLVGAAGTAALGLDRDGDAS